MVDELQFTNMVRSINRELGLDRKPNDVIDSALYAGVLSRKTATGDLFVLIPSLRRYLTHDDVVSISSEVLMPLDIEPTNKPAKRSRLIRLSFKMPSKSRGNPLPSGGRMD